MEALMRVLTYSLPAGRVLGIPLRINWLLLLFMPFIIAPYIRMGDLGVHWTLGLLFGLMFILILYGSVLLHELGHCWGMRLVGNTVREIQLTPLGGIAVGEGANASPRTELIVVGLGPAVSIALWFFGWGATMLLQSFWPGAPLILLVGVRWIFTINMMLSLFNLLVPIFPLDSAKLVRAGLAFWINPQKLTYYLAWGGLWLGVVIIAAGLFGIPLPIIGRASGFLFIIMIVCVQVCSITVKMLEYENVYSTYDQWGPKPVYYDAEQMLKVRMNLQEQLGWTGLRFGSRVRKSSPPVFAGPLKPAAPVVREKKARKKEPAKLLVAAPAPETLHDPDEIRELMQAAAESEDFGLAARLKRRLQEIERGQ